MGKKEDQPTISELRERTYLSPREAARVTGMGEHQVREDIKTGKVPIRNLGIGRNGRSTKQLIYMPGYMEYLKTQTKGA